MSLPCGGRPDVRARQAWVIMLLGEGQNLGSQFE